MMNTSQIDEVFAKHSPAQSQNHVNIYQNKSNAWQTLHALAQNGRTLTELFEDDRRGEHFALSSCDMYMDFSKQLIDDEVLSALLTLADDCQLSSKINDLLTGKKVNDTENRPALHTALRSPKGKMLIVDGMDVNAQVHDSLAKAKTMVKRIRTGVWRGYAGHAMTDVVNIGVGGSDLGPLMATTALSEWSDTPIRVHFVSNMDGTQLDGLLKVLNPQTTLFIISSKSFGTVDTLSNAKTALGWLMSAHDNKSTILRRHFIGISTRSDKMSQWGIHQSNQLLLWDWVGGRFSMWSVIGLAIAIKIGMDGFYELLSGAHSMDKHFATADFAQNMPVLLGLLGVWNSTFLGINAHSVLPYDGRLSHFPNYLTQLEMESNGKSVTRDGHQVGYDTCPILWGDIGSNAQHAFYQLLHQGTQRVSCDFITSIHRHHQHQMSNAHLSKQHQLSLSNCLAQSQVLAFGNHALPDDLDKNNDDFAKFKQYRGNQPSTTILLDSLNPKTLGSLIALYEHKVYVMSVIWQINPFDQWGVEVGKVMANQLYDVLCNKKGVESFDSSTKTLLDKIQGKF